MARYNNVKRTQNLGLKNCNATYNIQSYPFLTVVAYVMLKIHTFNNRKIE